MEHIIAAESVRTIRLVLLNYTEIKYTMSQGNK